MTTYETEAIPEHDQLPRGELFLGGEWSPARSGATFDTIDPATEEAITSVARGGHDDMHDAVCAARTAFDGPLRRLSPAERSRLLTRVARALESEADALAYLECRDTGKPLNFARAEIDGCVRYFEYYAGAADKIHGETLPLGADYLD